MLSSDIQGSNPDDLCRDLGIHGEILRKVMARITTLAGEASSE